MTRNLINSLLFWIGFAAVSFLSLFYLYLSGIQAQGPARVAPKEISRAMRYHGVQVAEWRGEWGFMRGKHWIPIHRRVK